MSDDHRPIGYWLKEVDRLLEESFARLLAEENLTRRHWQVLNTLATGSATTRADLDTALSPFLSDGEPGTAPIVADLAARGWVRGFALSAEGRAAHAALSERVRTDRRRITEGVTAEEYATVVGVLERMAANLAP